VRRKESVDSATFDESEEWQQTPSRLSRSSEYELLVCRNIFDLLYSIFDSMINGLF